jgi:hypothetical protein
MIRFKVTSLENPSLTSQLEKSHVFTSLDVFSLKSISTPETTLFT